MKKIIIILCLIATIGYGQKRNNIVRHTKSTNIETPIEKSITFDSIGSVEKTKIKWDKYVSFSLSISSGNSSGDNTNQYTFQESAYPDIEFGFTYQNLSIGGVIGRGNFNNTVNGIGNYFWEVRVTPTFQLGVVNASIIFGAGTYFNHEIGNGFIEYGSGIGYTIGKITYGISYSNFDGVDYITPNISLTFK
jgi:hypothetical protein